MSGHERYIYGYCQNQGIACLFLRPRFRQEAKRGAKLESRFHWNAAMHKMAAEAIADFLVARGLVQCCHPERFMGLRRTHRDEKHSDEKLASFDLCHPERAQRVEGPLSAHCTVPCQQVLPTARRTHQRQTTGILRPLSSGASLQSSRRGPYIAHARSPRQAFRRSGEAQPLVNLRSSCASRSDAEGPLYRTEAPVAVGQR